ncbi:hypothetical protein PAT3040_01959 [Paenibacillus agaridevorans]|uniref:Uncharacterized protein n=1 Tax=Paenibacillus agaridevorans TaxID=171404 RepID=A0A2R5EP30_9BACL|nr:hypothetical protein [Paenibacillus agaridevorans]GBG07409.1 hypothetical protein PAT3040_01959 [Paenibacillus agaridevorans]
MINNEKIERLSLFKDVVEIAKQKGIDVRFSNSEEINTSSDLGTSSYDPQKKIIQIDIHSSAINREEVYIHELLHAKSYLVGYPYIQSYNMIQMNSYMHKVIGSINNSFHHYIMVYPEMKRMGYSQYDIDKQFIDNIVENCDKTFVGTEKLAHAANLLELYLRSPESIEKLEEKIQRHQADEYQLFIEMKNSILQVSTPLEMRRAYAKVLMKLNEFVFKITKESLYLNIIILVSPIFPDSYYEEPASNSLYTLKLNGYPHVFVLDKDSNQCCYFLSNSGKDLDKSYVDNILQQFKLSDFIKMLG